MTGRQFRRLCEKTTKWVFVGITIFAIASEMWLHLIELTQFKFNILFLVAICALFLTNAFQHSETSDEIRKISGDVSRLSKDFSKFSRQSNREEESISDGLRTILSRHKYFSIVRIYAMTGIHLIGEISDGCLNRGVHIDVCQLLLYDPANDLSSRREQSDVTTIENMCLGTAAGFFVLRCVGRLERFLFGRHTTMATEFWFIFDDVAMLYGKFSQDKTNPVGVSPKLVRPYFNTDPKDKDFIKKTCLAHDDLIKRFPLTEVVAPADRPRLP